MEIDKNISSEKAELRDSPSENLHLLLDTIEGISQSRGLKTLLEESMEATRLVMSAEASSLMLLDEETGELNISLPTGPAKKEIRGKRIPKNKGIGGWVIDNKQPYLSNEPENSEIFWGEVAEEFKTRNIICVPLINKKNKAIGVLQALNKRKREDFNPHDIPVFQALASHVTMAIERVREQEELFSRINRQEERLAEFREKIKKYLDIVSLLIKRDIEGVNSDSSKEILQHTNERIDAMNEVQKQLTGKEAAEETELQEYLQQLVSKIRRIFSGLVRIETNVFGETVNIPTEKVITCGYLLHEILINVYSHYLADQQEGQISVEILTDEYDKVCIKVGDAGTDVLGDLFDANGDLAEIIGFNEMEKQGFSLEMDQNRAGFSIRFTK